MKEMKGDVVWYLVGVVDYGSSSCGIVVCGIVVCGIVVVLS